MRKRKCPSTIGFTLDAKPRLVYCGQWTCRYCAKHLSAIWAKRARLHIFKAVSTSDGPYWFLTLTLGSKFKTPRSGFAVLPKLWDTLRKCIQRSVPTFHYLAFVEGQPQRSNMPHFHILMNCEPPAKRNKRGEITEHALHDFAVSKGWGFEAYLEPVTDDQAGWYVAKYMSKQSPDTPKGFRRVRVSRGWARLKRTAHAPLIVPSRGEDITDFILRLADCTGQPEEVCYSQYVLANQMLAKERRWIEERISNESLD